jgi:hypothetical protein
MTSHDDEQAQQSHQSADTEKAQAKHFAKILRGELANMNEKVVAAEVEWHLRCESEGYVDPPERLVTVQGRIADIKRMLKALSARFPRV